MADFCRPRAQRRRGKATRASAIRNVVNIGIGGSDLGPVMAYEALRYYSERDLTFRFVSNVDGTDFAEAVRDLDPAETLFIVSSKTFTTLETMTNARTAREWLLAGVGGDERPSPGTSSRSRPMPRKSRSSASTPPTCSASGTGSAAATRWIRRSASRRCSPSARIISAPCSRASTRWTSTSAPRRSSSNLPVLMGLLGIWNTNFLGARDRRGPALRAVPEALPRLPAAVDDGEQRQARHARRRPRSAYETGPVYWGEPGTNGQHSFYQLIHQGTRLIPCDFIAFAQTLNPLGRHHDMLLANVFAQAEALAFGKTAEEVKAEGTPDWLVPAPRLRGQSAVEHDPARRLTPAALGSWSRSTSTSVFTQGVIWNIDSFDQWGVELGKVLAQRIIPELERP